jgi:Tol biopolymer transport system component
LSDSINSTTYQETAPFISYDGSRLYFTKCPVLGSAFYIYYSEKQNGIWQGAKRFEAAFNNDGYHNSWPCLTHDGRRFYFYSYIRPGGKGVGDLWYSDYDTVTQAWGLPVNLGDSINTPDWEFCPTLSWDDRTLYFQSDRAPTLKADIYRSVMVNGVWQGCTKLPEPINYPIGSSHYPCLSADGQHLFFGGVDLPLPSYGNLDIYDSRWVVGVEEPLSSTHLTPYATRLKVLPNPFTSFATLPGHEAERFSLYDVSGRKVGTNRGDRVGEGLAPGVYFLKYEEMLKQVQHDEIVRIVKVR